ncbi:hypothetical protein MIR68_009174 [Amoeboaphelidium protococcarum]|nr:hypothetical protein MIR68_009174 [Amoeboaphelidium protococcarum]
MRQYLCLFLASFALGAQIPFNRASLAPLRVPDVSPTAELAEDQYIVQMRGVDGDLETAAITGTTTLNAHLTWLQSVVAEANTQELQDVQSIVQQQYDFPGFQGYAGRFSPRVIDAIRGHPDVELVEQDMMVKLEYIHEDDQKIPEGIANIAWAHNKTSWGLQRVSQVDAVKQKGDQPGYPVYSFKGNDKETGKGVDIYIVDTGINVGHEQFEGRARWGKTTAWFSGNKDGNGHGSHCAGLSAGKTTGAAPKADLVAVKVLGPGGIGMISWIIAGLDYVVKDHKRKHSWWGGKKGNKKSVINMSLGGPFIQSLNAAADKVVENGIPIVAAAGNSAADACTFSPASAENVFTVGASDILDNPAFFSNYGSCVNVFSPGHFIYSSWNEGPKSYQVLSGTSMASPIAAGVLAAIWSGMDASASYKDAIEKLSKIANKDKIRNLDRASPNALVFNGAGAN